MKNKQMKRVIALLLSASITTTSISWNHLLTAQASETAESVEITPEEATAENVIEGEKTADTTVYDLGGNRKMEVFYGSDVRFENEEGELVDYEPSLVPVTDAKSIGGTGLEGYAYENKEGDSKQYLPEELSGDTPIVMEKEEYRITFHPVEPSEANPLVEEGESGKEEKPESKSAEMDEEIGGITSEKDFCEEEIENPSEEDGVKAEEPEKNSAIFRMLSVEEVKTTDLYGEESLKPMTAVYGDTGSSCSLEYESSDIGVKESIVLDEYPENHRFTFEFCLKGMDIRKNPVDEGFTLYDKDTGDIVGGIEAPYMNDASGEAYSEAVTCELEVKEGEADTYFLTVIPEDEYLKSEERVYPVVIDPTVTWADSTKMKEAYVCKNSPGTNYYSSGVTVLSVGNSTAQGLYRTFMKFDGIRVDYVNGKYVESAKLDLYETGKCVGGEYVQAHRITGSWAVGSLTWNNQPGYATGTYYDRFKTTGTAGTKHTLNLTEHARQMARGDYSSYGIMLRAGREGQTGFYTQFYGSRYATASKRPKLTIVYYDAPSKPASVQTNASYYKTGNTVQVSWSGISSRALDYVQYKVMYLEDSTDQSIREYIAYSDSTKIGTAASGTASISGSNTWPEGCYRIWVRGVDKSGIAGEGRSWNFHIDSTAPVVGGISTTPSGYTSTTNPVLSWNGASDKHLKEVQYQVGSAPYVRAGTGASGNVVIPSSYFQSSGTYTIRVRTVDQSGNYSAVKTLNYLVDITAPTYGTLTSVPAAGTWTESGNPVIQFKNIKELHSGISASGVQYCITEAGKAASTYQAASNVTFTSASNPYSGSFTMTSADQNKAEGAYTIHVRIQDKVGNAVLNSISYKRDKTAPTGTISYSQEKNALHDTVQITTDCKDGKGSGIKTSSLVIKDGYFLPEL